MELGNVDIKSIVGRLTEVEKQNRNLKRLFIVTLLLAGTVLLMGQATQNKVIEAQKFVVKSPDGKVRAVLSEDYDGADLVFKDSKGKDRISIGFTDLLGSNFTCRSREGVPQLFIVGNDNGTSLSINHPKGKKCGEGVYLTADEISGASARTIGDDGFMTWIGNSDLETSSTGETHHRSAASIVMFRKGGQVIWSAP